MNFIKLEGCGNSFVITDSQEEVIGDLSQLSRSICDKNFGIGADGFFLVSPGGGVNCEPFEVQMFNPDGSMMGMCGNGIRCVCRYLFMRGLVSDSARDLNFNVEGRQIDCQVDDCARMVRVAMGQPCFDPAKVPVRFDSEVIEGVLSVAESSFVFSAVSMGNPHCVIFVDQLDLIDLAALGPMIEHHQLFPQRTNVEFVEVVSDNRLKVMVWERGAGITLACGTGACAVVAAAVRRGFSGPDVQVELPGGVLDVNWEQDKGQIYLRGPAREICSGTWLGNSLGCGQ